MLSIEKKTYVERSVLASFIEFPSVGFKMVSKLKSEHFSSEHRQILFKFILEEKKAGRVIVPKHINPELMVEYKRIISESNLPNLKSNIELLIEEGYLNDMYQLANKIQEMTVNDNPLQKIINYSKKIINGMSIINDEFVMSLKDAIINISDGTISHKEYHIGWKTLDEYMPVSSQSITVIGGNEGAFKTKLMIYIMRSLLFQYKNISVLWYSMEDPADKIIRGFISQAEFLTDNELKKVNYSELIPVDVNQFDIEFVTKSETIEDIGIKYKAFREQREDKFCILIIDNAMKIIPVNYKIDPDLEILREIESWNVKTSNKEAAVYLLHHFTKEAISDKNREYGYKPSIKHLRGSGRYKDAATNVLLVNPMYSFSDIIDLFDGYEEFIKHFYSIDIAKNRNNTKTRIKMAAFPAFNLFFEL